jgi:negative regulator of flagellin synthesis FlgM
MNKITGGLPISNGVTKESHRPDNSPVVDTRSGSLTGAVIDSVELTGTAKKLQQAESGMVDINDIDTEKVAQIKAAIEKGSYRVNAEKVANNLLAMDKALRD